MKGKQFESLQDLQNSLESVTNDEISVFKARRGVFRDITYNVSFSVTKF